MYINANRGYRPCCCGTGCSCHQTTWTWTYPPEQMNEKHVRKIVQEELGRQSAESKQLDKLAKFIMDEVPGEPSESEGAVDCAIRIIREHLKESAK